jgi:hypothetical protein
VRTGGLEAWRHRVRRRRSRERQLDTKPPPKTLQTVLGTVLIVVIVPLDLAYQGMSGGRSVRTSGRRECDTP